MSTAKGKGQQAAGKHGRDGAPRVLTFALCLLPLALCLYDPAAAQKRPKPALSERDARRAIAAAPGFALREGAVLVREVSAAGVEPVTVRAEVTAAVRLASVEEESAAQTGGLFKTKRRRAVEFRTGDRSWEEFEFVADALGREAVERGRLLVEEMVTEFEARPPPSEGQAAEPLTRGAVTLRQLTPLGSSVVAELTVEATFRLAREPRGRWRVVEVTLGGLSGVDLQALWRRADEGKAGRARAELEEVRAALERFRSDRGFYVAADSEVVLMDHLTPFYLARVIRLDPWLRPYRYNGTRERFTLSSDGPDGKQNTPDDVTLAR